VAIKIDFLSNTRAVTRDVQDVGEAFDKVADSLDDVARDGVRSGDKLGDSFKDVAREAERSGEKVGDAYKDGAREGEQSAERLERAFKDASDATAKAAADGGRELGQSTRRGVDDAKEGLGEFRDEANSTAKESAASFDGSAESIGDAFQEIAANAFAGFGPAGAVAGLAAAAGLGLVFAQVEKNEERTEALREKVAELAAEYIDAGKDGGSSMTAVAERIRDMALATEDGDTSLSELRKTAAAADVPFDKLAKAMAGDSQALGELLDGTNEHIAALDRQNVSQDAVAGSGLRAASSADTQRAGLIALREKLEEQKTAQDQASESAQSYAATGVELLEKQVAAEEARTEATEHGAERRKAAIEGALEAEKTASEGYSSAVQGAYEAAGAAVDKYVEDGVFNLEKYTEESKAEADAVVQYAANMTALSGTLSDEALEYVAGLGPSAAPLIAAFVKAPLDQQQATADVWTQLGTTSFNSFGTTLQRNLDGSTFSSNVVLNPDMSRVQAELQRTRVINIEARVQNRIDLPARQGMGVP
jgi:hypothetical protein